MSLHAVQPVYWHKTGLKSLKRRGEEKDKANEEEGVTAGNEKTTDN